jgi:hypothetical protein
VNHDTEEVDAQKPDMPNVMIDFIESHAQKPASWPDLSSFKSTNLDLLFDKTKDTMYSLLIFEKKNSYFGRQVI